MMTEKQNGNVSWEIMVVDDNGSDLKYMSEILKNAGYRVRPAGDGELALRSARSKLPDLMLLDIKMPVMSGVEVCRRLKADPATREVPVIFISALGETDLKVTALEAGGIDYVTKPIDASEVLARINNHLTLHRLQGKLARQSEKLKAEIEVRKKAEKELNRHRRHLEAMIEERTATISHDRDLMERIMETSPAGIIFVDAGGRIAYANRRAEEVLGIQLLEAEARTYDDPKWKIMDLDGTVFPKEALPFYRVKQTGKPVYDVRYAIEWPDGRRVILSINGAPLLTASGAFDGMVGMFEDITELEKNEARLQQAQKMESVGLLAGGIAHDFNNILFPIMGLSELLLEDLPNESLEHGNMRQILKAAERGSELVQQILAFSRQSTHEMIPFRIQHVLKEVLKLTRSTIPANIEISQDIQGDCGLIMGDPAQIHQIVMNLLTNAYHAVERTGGNISVHLSEIVFDPESLPLPSLKPGDHAVLSISDTGHGIAPEHMDKIFEPYFTTKKQGKGTGLGLAVVYGIVKEHDGDVRVSSEVGRGSTFEVYLPLMEKAFETKPVKTLEIHPTGTESILLVDDEEVIAFLEKQMLERLGYRVTVFTNSLDAFHTFKADPHGFDLVLTDMAMPEMTGVQLAGEILSIKPDIPIIICTGFSDQIDAQTVESLGVKGFLKKPIPKSKMARSVREALDADAIS